ncbi:TRAP transporter large permease [Bacillota bacterium]
MDAIIMISILLILIVLLISGVPVPFSFGGAIIFLVALYGFDPTALFSTAYSKLGSITLLAIPMFILAGGIMEKGKIGKALVEWVNILVGRVKGGLAVVTVVASAIFGSICGSGAATLSCIGSIMAPQVRDKKYPLGVVAAVACCSGPLGLLIPPSAMQILVAWTLNLSVLACFLSTVAPGIILTILLCIGSVIMLRNDKNIEREEKHTFQEWSKIFGKSTVTAIPALFMPVLILGGIYSGIMTATESAGIAVIYSIPVAMFIYKGMKVKDLGNSLIETGTTTGVIMVMIGLVMMLSRLLTQINVPQALVKGMLSISDNEIIILIMLNLFLVFLGMVMDDASATLLAAPLLFPVILELGISPYHYAAILGVNIGMGNITPPSAPFLYLSSRIYGVDVGQIMKPVVFLLLFAYLPTLIITTFVPAVSLWLPGLVLGV